METQSANSEQCDKSSMAEPVVPPAPGPPELPYSLRTRKRSIAIFWSLFVIDTLAQPLILYFVLWYCTDLSHNLGKCLRNLLY